MASRGPRRRTRAATTAVLVTAVAVGVAACGTGWHGPAPTPGGPVAYVDDPSDGGDSALLDGTLALDSGCLTVVREDGTRVLTVFKQQRVSWDGTTLDANGWRVKVGGTISLGGGYSASSVDSAYVPDGCEYDEAFHVAS